MALLPILKNRSTGTVAPGARGRGTGRGEGGPGDGFNFGPKTQEQHCVKYLTVEHAPVRHVEWN